MIENVGSDFWLVEKRDYDLVRPEVGRLFASGRDFQQVDESVDQKRLRKRLEVSVAFRSDGLVRFAVDAFQLLHNRVLGSE